MSNLQVNQITSDKWLNSDGSENFKCRAWLTFNGQNTATIRASGNVSSLVDTGTGTYDVNFLKPMPDANYALVATGSLLNGSGASSGSQVMERLTTLTATVRTASMCPIHVVAVNGSTVVDGVSSHVAFFR